MKVKMIVTVALLAFIAASAGFLVFKELRPGDRSGISDAVAMEKKNPVPGAAGKVKPQAHQVIAYYFHATFRCYTCYRIEQLTKEAIMTGFPEELKDGRLVWKTVNVEDEGNSHFIKDYELFTKSVVIVDMKDGAQVRWKNLKEVWKLVDKKDAFRKYIQDETRAFLEKG